MEYKELWEDKDYFGNEKKKVYQDELYKLMSMNKPEKLLKLAVVSVFHSLVVRR